MASIDSLEYLDDLSRIRIEISGLSIPVTSITDAQGNEWSIFGNSEFSNGSGVIIPDDTSGVFTDYDPSFDISGVIDARATITANDFGAGHLQTIASRSSLSAGDRVWVWALSDEGYLDFSYSTNGTNLFLLRSSDPVTSDSSTVSVRVAFEPDNGDGGHQVTFYTSDSIDGPWEQLGDTIVDSGVVSLHQSSQNLYLGNQQSSINRYLDGAIGEFQLRDGVDGTLVASPLFSDVDDTTNYRLQRSIDGDDWVDVRGGHNIYNVESITIDDYEFTPDVENFYRLIDEDDTVLDEDAITPNVGCVWLKNISYPYVNMEFDCDEEQRSPCLSVESYTSASRTGIFEVVGRSRPVAVHDVHLDDTIMVTVVTKTISDHDRMKYLVMNCGPVFLSSPPESDDDDCSSWSMIPSGYYAVGPVTKTRVLPGSRTIQWDIEMTTVSRPGLGILPVTMPWNGVIERYDSWTDVLSSNESWDDLADNIADRSIAIIE
nr:hypothetical protein [uncultured bacterium]AMP54326.1 hypothetical protein [uncultured bacterium]AMP54379.1 hypothetical protein [uncultured bacterium]AMP54418.1 hypothetical protein [uncultured bacterium]AMP54463.1 hypothetical protein [uncultured bacterium]